jgi:hypothetical protein
MNDFTKEELEDLWLCCQGGTYDDHPLEDWKEALGLKIQSMIDNYCEHESATAQEAMKAAEKVMDRFSKAIDNLKDR